MTDLYVGLMSGTSMDGVDAVLVEMDPAGTMPLRVRAHAHRSFDSALAQVLLALNASGDDEVHRGALAGNALARHYAEAIDAVLDQARVDRRTVVAIGAHGQTVRHRPGAFDGVGYTVQINNAALLAELTDIDVVADFRSRDVAAGGQGAPLVPAFHRAMFGRAGATVAVLNIGGMSNLTVLHADGTTSGFDCGPGNVLMDGWTLRHQGAAYDAAGRWAASGRVSEHLLAALMAEPYFALPAPKSTGRDLFNLDWLDTLLNGGMGSQPLAIEDVQATLAELTARICSDAAKRAAGDAESLLVCGGGAFNTHLLARLAALLPGAHVRTSDEAGLPASQVEACAFAWLAQATVQRRCGNIAAVTGAAGPRVLGALYPAH